MRPETVMIASRPGSLRRAYGRVLGWVTIGWLAIVVVMAGVLLQLTQFIVLTEAAWIAAASLLIAYLSMIPGWITGSIASRRRDNSPDPAPSKASIGPWGTFYGVLLAGMVIRLLGTVALFLTCRYQMASSPESIAAMTIGWYVLLTSIEVVAVTRELPSCLDRVATCQGGARSPTAS